MTDGRDQEGDHPAGRDPTRPVDIASTGHLQSPDPWQPPADPPPPALALPASGTMPLHTMPLHTMPLNTMPPPDPWQRPADLPPPPGVSSVPSAPPPGPWQRPADLPPPPGVSSVPSAPPPGPWQRPVMVPAPYGPGGRTPSGRPSAGWLAAMVAGAVAVAVVAALLGGLVGGRIAGGTRQDLLPAAGPAVPARPPGSIAGIAARALPSVVTIKVEGPAGAGTGSGFVMRSDGYILTNNHVVAVAAPSGAIVVELASGQELPAKVVGRDASYDLAVVRVQRSGLPALRLGASADLAVGDPVIAVGAPLGLEGSVTTGIVSALNRPVTPGGGPDERSYINAIQTDAAINPGNSGGPLLDLSGRVIGITSAIARVPGIQSQSGSIGVGFAIPSDQARKTAEQLIATGTASHPVIGVLLDTAYQGPGVKIADRSVNGADPVSRGGPADKAGLEPGDVILALDGRAVRTADDLVVAIRAMDTGDVVTLTVRRQGTEHTVRMTLEAATG